MEPNTPRSIFPRRIYGVITFAILLYTALQHMGVLWAGVKFVVSIISPLLYGFFLAYIMNLLMVPIEKRLGFLDKRPRIRWLRRPLGIFLSLVLIAIVIALVVLVVYPQIEETVTTLINNSGVYLNNFSAWANGIMRALEMQEDVIEEIQLDWRTISTAALNFLKNRDDSLMSFATSLTSSLTTTILYIFIAFFTALHTLAKKERCFEVFQAASKRFLPDRVCRNLFHVVEIANHAFSHYLSGQLVEALLYGTLVTVGMMIFRFPYASVVGVLLFFTELVPVAGPWIGTILATLLIFIVSPAQAIWFLLFILVLQQVETNLIYPKVVGVHIGLPDLLVLVAVVIGSSRGILGIVLSVPLMAVAYTLLKEAIASGKPKEAAELPDAPEDAPEPPEAPEPPTDAPEDKPDAVS